MIGWRIKLSANGYFSFLCLPFLLLRQQKVGFSWIEVSHWISLRLYIPDDKQSVFLPNIAIAVTSQHQSVVSQIQRLGLPLLASDSPLYLPQSTHTMQNNTMQRNAHWCNILALKVQDPLWAQTSSCLNASGLQHRHLHIFWHPVLVFFGLGCLPKFDNIIPLKRY